MGRNTASRPSPTHQSQTVGAIIPRSLKWVTERGRLLRGYEHLLIQGMPMQHLPGVEQEGRCLLADLAGNAFNGASYTAAFISFCGSLPEDVELNMQISPQIEVMVGSMSDEEFASQIDVMVGSLYEVDEDRDAVDLAMLD